MHDIPDTLPAQLYLLAYDPRKRRIAGNLEFPYLIRAAALTDLLLSGRIRDESGKPWAVPNAPPVRDPVLADLLQKIADSRPRSWQRWIREDAKATLRAVRDGLETGRWVKVELRRPFLIFSRTLVHVRDPRVPKRLAGRVRAALSAPLSRVDDRDAALVALAASGGLKTVLSPRQRRANKSRIKAFQERGGPAGTALRKLIQSLHIAAATGAG